MTLQECIKLFPHFQVFDITILYVNMYKEIYYKMNRQNAMKILSKEILNKKVYAVTTFNVNKNITVVIIS